MDLSQLVVHDLFDRCDKHLVILLSYPRSVELLFLEQSFLRLAAADHKVLELVDKQYSGGASSLAVEEFIGAATNYKAPKGTRKYRRPETCTQLALFQLLVLLVFLLLAVAVLIVDVMLSDGV